MKYFENTYCSKPFGDFEISPDGMVHVCCPSYLKQPIGNAFEIEIDTLLSSNPLKMTHESMVEQDYRFCSWTECPAIREKLGSFEENLSEDMFEYNVKDVRLSYDPSCNLWCPSCRGEKCIVRGEQRDKVMDITFKTVIPLLKSAKSLVMNGYGDIFAARSCRAIMEELSSKNAPKLQYDFITNAVLFSEDNWNKYHNLHDMVNSIRVSIDASKKETYDKVRLGGDWEKLMTNLKFISRLRKNGVIKNFMISFVVQYENYLEVVDFAKFGIKLGCDQIIFENIMDWNVLERPDFLMQAVHYPDHLNHKKYIDIMQKLAEIKPQDMLVGSAINDIKER